MNEENNNNQFESNQAPIANENQFQGAQNVNNAVNTNEVQAPQQESTPIVEQSVQTQTAPIANENQFQGAQNVNNAVNTNEVQAPQQESTPIVEQSVQTQTAPIANENQFQGAQNVNNAVNTNEVQAPQQESTPIVEQSVQTQTAPIVDNVVNTIENTVVSKKNYTGIIIIAVIAVIAIGAIVYFLNSSNNANPNNNSVDNNKNNATSDTNANNNNNNNKVVETIGNFSIKEDGSAIMKVGKYDIPLTQKEYKGYGARVWKSSDEQPLADNKKINKLNEVGSKMVATFDYEGKNFNFTIIPSSLKNTYHPSIDSTNLYMYKDGKRGTGEDYIDQGGYSVLENQEGSDNYLDYPYIHSRVFDIIFGNIDQVENLVFNGDSLDTKECKFFEQMLDIYGYQNAIKVTVSKSDDDDDISYELDTSFKSNYEGSYSNATIQIKCGVGNYKSSTMWLAPMIPVSY